MTQLILSITRPITAMTHPITAIMGPVMAMMGPITVGVLTQSVPTSLCPHVTFGAAAHVPVADLAQLPAVLVRMVETGTAVICRDTGTRGGHEVGGGHKWKGPVGDMGTER